MGAGQLGLCIETVYNGTHSPGIDIAKGGKGTECRLIKLSVAILSILKKKPTHPQNDQPCSESSIRRIIIARCCLYLYFGTLLVPLYTPFFLLVKMVASIEVVNSNFVGGSFWI